MKGCLNQRSRLRRVHVLFGCDIDLSLSISYLNRARANHDDDFFFYDTFSLFLWKGGHFAGIYVGSDGVIRVFQGLNLILRHDISTYANRDSYGQNS